MSVSTLLPRGLVVGGLLIFAVAVFLWVKSAGAPTPHSATVLPTAPTQETPEPALPKAHTISRTPEITDPLAGERLLSSYACGGMPPCSGRNRAFSAQSVEEAMWMKANGFPTQAEREWAAQRRSDEILRRAKAEGSPALEALALEARLRERSLPVHALEVREEAIDAAMRTGKRYFLYSAFDAALIRSKESAQRFNRAIERASTPQQPLVGRMQIDGNTPAEIISTAMLLGDYRAVDLMNRIGDQDLELVRAAYANPQTARAAWERVRTATQTYGTPLALQTMQPRPLPLPGSGP